MLLKAKHFKTKHNKLRLKESLRKQDKVFCAPTVWLLSMRETAERQLRDNWKTTERQLRDSWKTAETWETPERQLRDSWETADS